jgi:D-aminoacyl-tRNA deacylase
MSFMCSTPILSAPVIIVVSKRDPAGMNMRERLLSKLDFEQEILSSPKHWPIGKYELHRSTKAVLLTIVEDQIFTDYFKGCFSANLIIFASKHSSTAGVKTLLVHTTGVWGTAHPDHGGNDRELSIAPSFALYEAYHRILTKQKEEDLNDYWVGLEVSHHGPTSLAIPLIFIETGGTEVEWNDKKACNIIADVIIELLDFFQESYHIGDKPALIGIGGTHYCPSFAKKIQAKQYQLGHVTPKYSHEFVDEAMLKQAYEKTLASEKVFLIDKKGTKSVYRKKFIEIIEKNNWEWHYT